MLGMGSESVIGKGLPESVRMVMVLQSVVVAFLSFWIGKEYVNNVYLRQYVQSVAWTYLPVLTFVATFAVAVGVSEAYARLKGLNGGESLRPESVPSSGLRPAGGSGLGLEHGFAGSPVGNRAMSDVSNSVQGSDWTGLGVSFAEVFSEWRPPVLLKHVEQTEGSTEDLYAPKPFPVIRRLEPAREPVEEERPKVTPRVLNRIGPAQALLVPLPPVLRQIKQEEESGGGLEGKPSSDKARATRKRLESRERSEDSPGHDSD